MKYEIMMSCGHEDTVELFGKEKERDRKIEYFKIHGLCKECYRKKKEEETQKEGLIFNATVLPYINEKDGSILLSVWFSGDTKPYKMKLNRWEIIAGVKGNRQTIGILFSFQHYVGIKS